MTDTTETRSKLVTLRMKPRLYGLVEADALETNTGVSQVIRHILAIHYGSER